eukprot:tig00020930_g16041.t1
MAAFFADSSGDPKYAFEVLSAPAAATNMSAAVPRSKQSLPRKRPGEPIGAFSSTLDAKTLRYTRLWFRLRCLRGPRPQPDQEDRTVEKPIAASLPGARRLSWAGGVGLPLSLRLRCLRAPRRPAERQKRPREAAGVDPRAEKHARTGEESFVEDIEAWLDGMRPSYRPPSGRGRPSGSGSGSRIEDEDRVRMERRARRFAEPPGARAAGPGAVSALQSRMRAMQLGMDGASEEGSVDASDHAPIVGTSAALEKPYFRLTSAPDPAEVRPQRVLERALAHVRERRAGGGATWHWVNDQMRSIRQDMTVQGIRNEFAVEVYVAHGRMCIEQGDTDGFNQCQAQLFALFARGLAPGAGEGDPLPEYLAYRLVYAETHGLAADLARAFRTASELGLEDHPAVRLASRVRPRPRLPRPAAPAAGASAARADGARGAGRELRRILPRLRRRRGARPLLRRLAEPLAARTRRAALRAAARSYRPEVEAAWLEEALQLPPGGLAAFLADAWKLELGPLLAAGGAAVDGKLLDAALRSKA